MIISNQMGIDTEVDVDKTVVQSAPNATIDSIRDRPFGI